MKDATLHHSWLPGIPVKDRWEDDYGKSGVKVTIATNLHTVLEG